MGYGKLRKSLKTGMGGSHCGKGRSEKTGLMKTYSKVLRRQSDRVECVEQLTELDKTEFGADS